MRALKVCLFFFTICKAQLIDSDFCDEDQLKVCMNGIDTKKRQEWIDATANGCVANFCPSKIPAYPVSDIPKCD